jgi:hypothetical protein
MYGRGDANGTNTNGASSMPPSLGYLPRTFEPTVPTFQMLRPQEQHSAPTSHAPLRQSAEIATRIPLSSTSGAAVPPPGSTAYPPTSTLLRLPQPERYEDGRLVSSALGAGSPSLRQLRGGPRQQAVPAVDTTSQRRRLAVGTPARLYDGGVHTVGGAAVRTPAPSSSAGGDSGSALRSF